MFSEKWASSFDILKFHKLLSSTEEKKKKRSDHPNILSPKAAHK